MAATADEVVTLESGDIQPVRITVPTRVAAMSKTIQNLMEDLRVDGVVDDSPIILPNVKHATLTKVLAYCEYHKDDVALTEEQQAEEKAKNIEGWDKDFVPVELAPLFELILAANFLDIKPLLDLTCKSVAHMLRGKTPDEIKNIFGVEGEFTQEEEDQVRRDNEWLGDKPSGLIKPATAVGAGAVAAPTTAAATVATTADVV
jgi:S-phase kinase-associated protein 1